MNGLYRANEGLIERLNDSIRKGSVFHACIVASRYQQDRETFAKEYAKAILCHRDIGDRSDSIICSKVDAEKHEDVIFLRKKKNKIPVEDVRAMQKRIAVKPFGERYIVIIADGDLLEDVGQNTLLKTLEEPPGETVMIILVEDVENLLDTIKSRCTIYSLEEGDSGENEEIRHIAALAMDMSSDGAPYYRLKKITDPIESDRDSLRLFIDMAEEICRNRLFESDEKGIPHNHEKTGSDIHALENARRKLDRGLSPRYTLKELLITIGG